MSQHPGEAKIGDDLLELVHVPLAIETLGDGWVLIRKAGVVGVGPSPHEAGRDLLSKLRVVITHMRWQP